MSIGFTICHAKHKPERHATMARLLEQLGDVPLYVEDRPGTWAEWSLRQWEGGLALGTDYVCCLNDDITLCPDFHAVLANVIKARPEHCVALYNCHKLANDAVKRGMSWLTSADGMLGIAYVVPADPLRAFLVWRATMLTEGTVDVLTEDQTWNLFMMAHGCLTWHTVPALVAHDESVASCYGNTQCRQATVGPRPGMLDVNWDTDALHTGRVFKGNHHALLTRVKGDRGPLVKRFYALAGDCLF